MQDRHIHIITSLRASAIGILAITGSLGCVVAGVVTTDKSLEPWIYLSASVQAVSGIIATAIGRAHRGIVEDIRDISDQVRTNTLYAEMTRSDTPQDLSGSTYRWVIKSLGQGRTKEEILKTIHPATDQAMAIWDALERQYGKLPDGGV